MAYGDRSLARGDAGNDVVELQMRLSGFLGTVPDGDFGPGTERQVKAFQREYMKRDDPDGRVNDSVFDAIRDFAARHPVDFSQLDCACGECGGFGKGQFRGVYRNNRHDEAFHRYEYPGIHRMLLWAYRAAQFHARERSWQLRVNSGYRCAIDNRNHGRASTNHHGKAIDLDVVGASGRAVDEANSNALRAMLVDRAQAQIGWAARNRKALEPADIAPTWVHYDVRTYDPEYLDDRYFVKTAAQLDAPV